jgi:hypothetical protein
MIFTILDIHCETIMQDNSSEMFRYLIITIEEFNQSVCTELQ